MPVLTAYQLSGMKSWRVSFVCCFWHRQMRGLCLVWGNNQCDWMFYSFLLAVHHQIRSKVFSQDLACWIFRAERKGTQFICVQCALSFEFKCLWSCLRVELFCHNWWWNTSRALLALMQATEDQEVGRDRILDRIMNHGLSRLGLTKSLEADRGSLLAALKFSLMKIIVMMQWWYHANSCMT